MSRIALILISFYQKYLSFDSGALRILVPGGACKYNPTCSEYMKQAIIKFGFWKGFILGTKRIISCR